MLKGEKILITGVTGTAPMPVAEFLVRENEVWGVARFANDAARQRLEASGVKTVAVDLAAPDFSRLPRDFTILILCAHQRLGPGQFHEAVAINAVGAGLVLQHFSNARAALIFSSGAIYSAGHKDGHYPYRETDDIGRAFPPWSPTSPVSKASLEAVARFAARAFRIPVTIARLNIVYGPGYGMPFMDADAIAAGREIVSFADPYPVNPIHSDDMCAQIGALIDAASVPATIVNWCGDDVVTRHDWIARAASLLGKPARLRSVPAPDMPPGSVLDSTLRTSITGPSGTRFWDAFDATIRALCQGKDNA